MRGPQLHSAGIGRTGLMWPPARRSPIVVHVPPGQLERLVAEEGLHLAERQGQVVRRKRYVVLMPMPRRSSA